MKKFISLMMAIFCVVTFSMSAFADPITNEPRIALNCPVVGVDLLSVRLANEPQPFMKIVITA